MTTTARERPILFSGPMVRAILDGRKTQTRRIVKPQPDSNINPVWIAELGCFQWATIASRRVCPYGRVGDRLWVRERHVLCHGMSQLATSENATYCCFPDGSQKFRWDGGYYADPHPEVPKTNWPSSMRWRPSIHMPRWASRITLEITDVRAERLQDITEEDAIAEGLKPALYAGWFGSEQSGDRVFGTPREAFADRWNALHNDRAWQRNDWVWALTFKRSEVSK